MDLSRLCSCLPVNLLLPSVHIHSLRRRDTEANHPAGPHLITSWPQCDDWSWLGRVTCQMADLARNQRSPSFFLLLSNWLNTQGSCEINQAIWLRPMHVVRLSAFVTQSMTYSSQTMDSVWQKKNHNWIKRWQEVHDMRLKTTATRQSDSESVLSHCQG